jgi:Na+-translocating ferredoxin:NAD+ oxidoreductase RnfG subunit
MNSANVCGYRVIDEIEGGPTPGKGDRIKHKLYSVVIIGEGEHILSKGELPWMSAK